jgi:hypothetical protein
MTGRGFIGRSHAEDIERIGKDRVLLHAGAGSLRGVA